MTQELIWFNPISNKNESISIEIFDYDEMLWFVFLNNINDINKALNSTLNDLNCTIEYKGKQMRSTKDLIYKVNIAKYIKFLYRITNPFIYNQWFQKLIDTHTNNIIYESQIKQEEPMLKRGDKKSSIVPNKFIKAESTDIFTGETIYIYDNPKTGESIRSDDPNLLSVLNSKEYKKKAKKEREKKVKEKIIINTNDIQFKF